MGKKNKTKKSGFNTQKIFKIVRIAALALPAVGIALSSEPVKTKIWRAGKAYFGYDSATRKFSLGDLAQGWAPFVGSIVVTYGIPKLAGLIRSF